MKSGWHRVWEETINRDVAIQRWYDALPERFGESMRKAAAQFAEIERQMAVSAEKMIKAFAEFGKAMRGEK